MRAKRYPKPETFTRVSVEQLAREIDRSPRQTEKVIERAARLGLLHARITRPGTATTYDAIEVETIKALLGVPDRPAPQPQDWLSDYEKETTDARRKRSRKPHRTRSTQP